MKINWHKVDNFSKYVNILVVKKGDNGMTYHIRLNYRQIKKYNNLFKLSHETVHSYVDIDHSLLLEKDSWYLIDTKACFFKERNEGCLAGECISQLYAETLGEETAKYSVVTLNDSLGLLSENFQDRSKYQYYDLCQLYELFPAFPKTYNNYSLKKILEAFEYYYTDRDYQTIQQNLIKRYLFDWFTHQTDGNPRNNNLKYNKNNANLEIGPLFDREQSFGVNSNGLFDEQILNIWVPAIPYEDLDFKNAPYLIEGLDANVFSLLVDYPEMTIKALEWLFSVDYVNLLDKFHDSDHAIMLPDDAVNYLKNIYYKKEIEKEKLLTLV